MLLAHCANPRQTKGLVPSPPASLRGLPGLSPPARGTAKMEGRLLRLHMAPGGWHRCLGQPGSYPHQPSGGKGSTHPHPLSQPRQGPSDPLRPGDRAVGAGLKLEGGIPPSPSRGPPGTMGEPGKSLLRGLCGDQPRDFPLRGGWFREGVLAPAAAVGRNLGPSSCTGALKAVTGGVHRAGPMGGWDRRVKGGEAAGLSGEGRS